MSEISKRIWNEPSVAIGFVTSLTVIIVTVILGNDWDVATILGALAPFMASLGIRGQVTPTIGKYEYRADEAEVEAEAPPSPPPTTNDDS